VQRWGSGSSSLADVLAPAIELAEGGFPVGPVASFEWQKGAETIREAGGPGVLALITEEGCGPKPGQVWRNADLAATFRRLAEHGARKGACEQCVAGSSMLRVRQTGVMMVADSGSHRAGAQCGFLQAVLPQVRVLLMQCSVTGLQAMCSTVSSHCQPC
jgi:gamma-glutamyltranspeptidase/glutathione hydrolase